MSGNQTHALETVLSGGADNDALQPGCDPKLRVTVVHTTPEGTLAALRAAADLVKQLDGRLALFAPEVVPFLLPLEEPHVAIEFLKRRYCDLVAEAGLVDEDVTIRILLCRDRAAALKQALTPRSLVLIGGSVRWWNRKERRLARGLRKLGHRVVFVDSATKESPRLEAEIGRQASFFRVVEKQTRGVHR